MKSGLLVSGLILALVFCVTAPSLAATDAGLAIADPGLKAAKALQVTSPKIASGGVIPEVYSAYGQSVSPPLSWTKGPAATQSFVLVVEDPDAPMPTPFVHWMVWNIPASVTQIAEGAAPADARQGKLMFVGTVGYMGPRPPAGGPHHYHFQVFALDRPLDLAAGAERAALVDAMRGHVLASGQLTATYQKQ